MMRVKLMVPFLGILLCLFSMYMKSFTAASIIFHPPEVKSNVPAYKYLKYSTEVKSKPPLMKINKDDLNDAVDFGETIINRMSRLETNLGWADIRVKPGTAAHGQLIENTASDEALDLGRVATIAAKASQHLMNMFCSKHDDPQCVKQLSTYNMSSTNLGPICQVMTKKCESDIILKYRSTDGSCNNLNNGVIGKSLTEYKRLMYPSYHDGILEPRRSVLRKPLPSARLISTKMMDNINYLDSHRTLAFMQWMQFVEHDLVHTASSKMISSKDSIICCDKWGYSLAPRYKHPFCLPISVPADDPFYSKYRSSCMSYVRSLPAVPSDCSFGPIDQINLATHYLDASHIYGTNDKLAESLREMRGGRLLVSKKNFKEFLPVSSTPKEDCQVTSDDSECYRAGDSRVNLHPHLTAMYTLWLREHNRIASSLQIWNTEWTDEKLYQEARSIVIAEIQHITYTEWIPALFGRQIMDLTEDYDRNVDPSITNAFATAAVRFINSLMEANINIYEENRVANKTLRLQDHFNKPFIIKSPDHLDGLVRGLATQRSGKLDMNLVPDISEQLYRHDKFGFDALSLDVQRGRDHGLPSYAEYRKFCGLGSVTQFEDLLDVMEEENIQALRNVYSTPKDIDLIIGGMAELPDKDSIVGPTFSCLITEQLYRTRIGDRMFYNHKRTDGFNAKQITEIEKASLARIFCDNGDNIKRMQSNVFEAITEMNKLLNCEDDDIPSVNLLSWKE